MGHLRSWRVKTLEFSNHTFSVGFKNPGMGRIIRIVRRMTQTITPVAERRDSGEERECYSLGKPIYYLLRPVSSPLSRSRARPMIGLSFRGTPSVPCRPVCPWCCCRFVDVSYVSSGGHIIRNVCSRAI